MIGCTLAKPWRRSAFPNHDPFAARPNHPRGSAPHRRCPLLPELNVEARSLQYIAAACAGELLLGSAALEVRRVGTDSRHVQAGDLFLALAGDKFDGHDFLTEVLAKGAVAVMVERRRLPLPPLAGAVIVVENTRQALGRLAAFYRQDFALPAVAVAGSNGKSTTKELIAAVLRQRLATLHSEASFNNDIGVPLSLLRLEHRHQAAVLEVGTNHPGELPPLLAMIQPRYGVMTSLGREHLEFFGDLEGVVREEGWLAELLPAAGRLFLNADHELTEMIARRSRAPVTRVGWHPAHDWQASAARLDDQGTTFTVRASQPDYAGEYRVNLLGRHQVTNALLALAVGAEFGLAPEELRSGLAGCHPLKMRLQLWEAQGVRVLDDTYNANADSMLAALQTLHDLPCAGRRIAVLGDMAEQGSRAAEAHAEVGRRAAELGIHHLFAVGVMAAQTVRAARRAGLQEAVEFRDTAQASRTITRLTQPGDLVLLKASRVSGLERLSRALRQARNLSPAAH